jgi:SNF2 family DNA or RNA helicase
MTDDELEAMLHDLGLQLELSTTTQQEEQDNGNDKSEGPGRESSRHATSERGQGDINLGSDGSNRIAGSTSDERSIIPDPREDVEPESSSSRQAMESSGSRNGDAGKDTSEGNSELVRADSSNEERNDSGGVGGWGNLQTDGPVSDEAILSELDFPEPDWEFESELLLRSVEADLVLAREEFKMETSELERMKIERDQLMKRLDEMNRILRQQELRRQEVAEKGRRLKEDQLRAEQQLAIDKANKEQQDNLLARQSTFEARTNECPWRTGIRYVSKAIDPKGYYEVPKIMKHQEIASDMIASSERALLADGMGLGKTHSALAGVSKLDPGILAPDGINHLEGGRNPSLRILYICPAEGMTDVFDSIKKWTYYSPFILGRKNKKQQKKILEDIINYNMRGVIVITNYAAWSQDKEILQWMNEDQFDMVIVDEAHHMKNCDTSTYKGIRELVTNRNTCGECGAVITSKSEWQCPNACLQDDNNRGGGRIPADTVSSVKYFLAMTGTFILNKPREIYASLHLARPELFMTEADFKRKFCGWSAEEWSYGGQAKLAQEISGFYMRRTREDAGVVLPKQTTYIHEIEINQDEFPLQFQIMEDLRKRAVIQIEETENETGQEFPQFNLLALITRQRQATVWPGGIYINEVSVDSSGFPLFDMNLKPVTQRVHIGQHFQESAKINMCMEIVDELREDNHVIVIASQFLEALHEVKRRCEVRGLRVGELTGAVSVKHKEAVKRNLLRANNETPEYDVVIMHYQTGGEALNLTAATAMIILDEEWNEGKHDQATGRLDRTGQTEESQVHILRHVGPQESIDTWLQELVERKRKVVHGFNNSVAELKTAFGK